MDKLANVKAAQQLIHQIDKYDELYFNSETGSPISDEAYDALWFQLNELLQDADVRNALSRDAMPLGTMHSNKLHKIRHLVPVLSLDKAKAADFEKPLKRLIKQQQAERFVIEPKYDGLTLVIYGTKSGPVCVTRGAGELGEDVTEQVRNIPTLRDVLPCLPEGMIVKGEAFVLQSDFAPERYATPRAQASAIVRSLDVSLTEQYGLTFIAYEVLGRFDSKNELANLQLLKEFGFYTTDAICVLADDLINEIRTDIIMHDYRLSHPDLTLDGMVVKPLTTDKLDYTSHHVKGQIAVKFPPEGRETSITDVVWTQGKTGKLTPVAVIEPVTINGSTITKVSLGSYALAQSLGAGAGAHVFVELSNDVIPRVASVMLQSHELHLPDNATIEGAHAFSPMQIELPLLQQWLSAAGVKHAKQQVKQLANGVSSTIAELFTDDSAIANGLKLRLKARQPDKLIIALHLPGVGAKATKQLIDTDATVDELVALVHSSCHARLTPQDIDTLDNVMKFAKGDM